MPATGQSDAERQVATGRRGGRDQGEAGGQAAAGRARRIDCSGCARNTRGELQRSRESLGRMRRRSSATARAARRPNSTSSAARRPGNEAFKQDFGGWESLRKDVDLALEQYEAGSSARLARKAGDDRLSAGGSERVPDAYRPLVVEVLRVAREGQEVM